MIFNVTETLQWTALQTEPGNVALRRAGVDVQFLGGLDVLLATEVNTKRIEQILLNGGGKPCPGLLAEELTEHLGGVLA